MFIPNALFPTAGRAAIIVNAPGRSCSFESKSQSPVFIRHGGSGLPSSSQTDCNTSSKHDHGSTDCVSDILSSSSSSLATSESASSTELQSVSFIESAKETSFRCTDSDLTILQ